MTTRFDMHFDAIHEDEIPYEETKIRNGEYGPIRVFSKAGVKVKRPRGRLLPNTDYRTYYRASKVSDDGTYIRADSSPGATLRTGVAYTLFDDRPSELESLLNQAAQAAVEKVDGNLGDNPMTLVNLGESDTSLKTIEKRLVQCYSGFSALKRLRFYDAAVAWNLVRDSKPKGVRRLGRTKKLRWTKHPITGKYYPRPIKRLWARKASKDVSGLILEYNFAWSPAVQDIQTAVAALDRPFAYESKVERRQVIVKDLIERYETPSFKHTYEHKVNVVCRVGFRIGIENPNYELLSRLGLVDLASTALELVPFSFVANWFVNLDAYVRQISLATDPRIKNPWYSYKLTDSASHRVSEYLGDVFLRSPVHHETVAVSYRRFKGSLAPISLAIRPTFVTSLARATNMSALIVQLFGRDR